MKKKESDALGILDYLRRNIPEEQKELEDTEDEEELVLTKPRPTKSIYS